MTFLLLSVQQIIDLHDGILNPGELQGMAKDKSLDGALSRVENRLAYGMIEDAFALAAAQAMAVAQGHCFNDGNKRTAYRTLIVSLFLNGVTLNVAPTVIGDQIIRLAQGHLPEDDFTAWLRGQV
ncbi:death on curing protein [Loktanella atrilutea]|uniref:Death on curing protein n=1 Tax=Loktanella atrilutea TaxID=366533 RepID=A0A1M5A1C6_LOKAT|nr:type II toxin-antitoxin system death-on-curing family toxin [Loktanella atrilutea]SHF24093.1 death on curing protein [Loktanella atrilutea]